MTVSTRPQNKRRNRGGWQASGNQRPDHLLQALPLNEGVPTFVFKNRLCIDPREREFHSMTWHQISSKSTGALWLMRPPGRWTSSSPKGIGIGLGGRKENWPSNKDNNDLTTTHDDVRLLTLIPLALDLGICPGRRLLRGPRQLLPSPV